MNTQKLHDLIDKVIGKDGPLRTPAWWMRRVLDSIVVHTVVLYETILSSVQAKFDDVESRLDDIQDKFDDVESRLDDIQAKFDDVESRLSYVENMTLFDRYFTVVALEDDVTVTLSRSACQYRVDGGEWTILEANTATPAVNTGQSIEFKANAIPVSLIGIGTFTFSKRVRIQGSVMSLIHGDDFKDQSMKSYAFYGLFRNCGTLISVASNLLPSMTISSYCYREMFSGCTSLVNAPELPATTLVSECYKQMFYGCTSLVNAPELPATNLSYWCYRQMFSGCTSLVNAPELPATTLAIGCYSYMFHGCTSLVNAPELPATTLVSECYKQMFSGCTSLVNAPELPATTLVSECYKQMFSGCTSLVNAPELPATTLAIGCYSYMFHGCSKLSYIKAMFSHAPSSTFTSYWVKNVSPTGTFVKNAAATWNEIGSNGIPTGWTVELAEV